MAIVELKNLSFCYTPETPIFGDLNLSFDAGSTAIIGQNGAGKTTLVKLIKGLLRPTSGSIYCNGSNVADMSVPALAKEVGYVFQNPNDQIFESSVLSEVMFGPLQIGMDEKTARTKALRALELVGLSDVTSIHPYDLGLSDRKMVSIASILSMDTQVVIFDEPTIAQDYGGRQRLKDIIQQLVKQGKVVISILHDMDFVAEVFERVIVMAHGTVLCQGDPRYVFEQVDALKEARIEQPTVTQLAHALSLGGTTPLTIDEFVDEFKCRRV